MSHNLTNFLPRDKVHRVRIEYFLRLLTIVLLGAVLVVVAHGLLLLPTYKYVVEERDALTNHLAELSRTQGVSDQEALRTRLRTLQEDAQRLVTFTTASPASLIIGSVLLVPHAGIAISGFTLDAGNVTERKLRLTGVASTREALRQYHQALSALPFVTKADLPLSAYAKENDIAFTILLSGKLTP